MQAVTRERLYDLARVFGVRLRPDHGARPALARTLGSVIGRERLLDVLRELGRDELRAVCRAHDLPDTDAARERLLQRLADAAGVDVEAPREERVPQPAGLPRVGQVLAARGRQWLVEALGMGTDDRDSPLLQLACLDDDLGVMDEAIDERDDARGVREDGVPLGEGLVGRDDDRFVRVATADDLKEQVGVAVAIGGISQLLDDEKLGAKRPTDPALQPSEASV